MLIAAVMRLHLPFDFIWKKKPFIPFGRKKRRQKLSSAQQIARIIMSATLIHSSVCFCLFLLSDSVRLKYNKPEKNYIKKNAIYIYVVCRLQRSGRRPTFTSCVYYVRQDAQWQSEHVVVSLGNLSRKQKVVQYNSREGFFLCLCVFLVVFF